MNIQSKTSFPAAIFWFNVVFSVLNLSTQQTAVAMDWDMAAYQGDSDTYTSATSWRYHVTDYNPGNIGSCPILWSYWSSSTYMNVFDEASPFSGSKVRSRWVTLCNDYSGGQFITYELTLSFNNCGLWLCDKTWTDHISNINFAPAPKKWILGGTTFSPNTRELDIILPAPNRRALLVEDQERRSSETTSSRALRGETPKIASQ